MLLRGFARARAPALLEALGKVTAQAPFRFLTTPGGYQMSVAMTNCGAVGWISDRNFLEEYYKNEWDNHKDETTGLELKRISGNSSWSITADVRINDFFTQTNWLPRADHFWLIG